jgi:hypothetical protein
MATFYTLEDVLHPQVVTELYRTETQKVFSHPLIDYYGQQSRNYTGDRFEFAYREAMKQPAPANVRGQSARVLQPTGSSPRRVFLLHAFNEISLSMDALQMIRRPDDQTTQEKGQEEIVRQMEDFGARHHIFRAVCLAKTLADGVIHFSADGQVLESPTGAAYSVDFGVPDSHKGQLDGFGSTLINTAWDDPTAKILDHLDSIRIRAEEENAEEPRHIWLHHSAKRWLRQNVQMQDYVVGTSEAVDRALRGTMIEDLAGWTWHFFSGTYQGVAGLQFPYIPRTRAIITPDIGPWLRAVNGSELITGVEGIRPTVDGALQDVSEVFGDFAYVKLLDNPTKLVLRMGTNFVYAFANPLAVWMPTVDF